MGWKAFIPFFDRQNRLRYKKASTSTSTSNNNTTPNPNPAYVYCRQGVSRSSGGYTCYLTVSDAVSGDGPSEYYNQLPPNAIVVPIPKS